MNSFKNGNICFVATLCSSLPSECLQTGYYPLDRYIENFRNKLGDVQEEIGTSPKKMIVGVVKVVFMKPVIYAESMAFSYDFKFQEVQEAFYFSLMDVSRQYMSS